MAASTILSDPDLLGELLSLLGGADSVELKLTVADGEQRSAADALGLDPLKAEIRQVVFFDTPNLDLYSNGLVVRARRRQTGAGDTVVKLRPVVPADVSDEMRNAGSVKVEVDAMPGGFVCSASMKGKTTAKAVRRVARGKERIPTLFSTEQKAFFKSNAPAGLELRDLSPLGPINIFKLEFSPAKLGRGMVAEMWLYPNGSRILELSTKAKPLEAFGVATEARAFLEGHGIDLDGRQQTKTKTALGFFAALVREQRSTEPAIAS